MSLNIKQKLFIDLYTDKTNLEYLGNATKCYKAVYGVKDDNSAAVNGNALLRNPKIINYMNNKEKSILEILAENSRMILETAINEAKKGNTSVLNKLLDKIAPSLAENNNTTTELNIDDYLRNLLNNADKVSQTASPINKDSGAERGNKTDSSNNGDSPQATKPVSVDNKTS